MSRYLSQAALAAKSIRNDLKKEFPSISFRVTCKNYSMGDHVNVYYTDGVPTKDVECLIKKYQYGHFDGMQDLYEYSNSRNDIPQTKYLFVERDYSQQAQQKAWNDIVSYGLGMTCRGWEKADVISEWDKPCAIRHELIDKTI